MHYDVAYVKGGERERFNPLTGVRYDRVQTHDLNDPDEQLQVASTSTIAANRDSYVSRRGKPEYYKRGRGVSNWGTNRRSNSPYQRPQKEQPVKQSTSDKHKDKQL